MKIVHQGKTIEVPDSHGRLLIKKGRATLPKITARNVPAVETEAAAPVVKPAEVAAPARTAKKIKI